MGIKLKNINTAGAWKKVDVGSAGDFEVQTRPPTFAEILADESLRQSNWFGMDTEASIANRIEGRLQAVIIGWRGVENDSGPIPFSWPALQTVCEQFICFGKLLEIANGLYHGLEQDAEKNSDAPSSAAFAGTNGTGTESGGPLSTDTSGTVKSEGTAPPQE